MPKTRCLSDSGGSRSGAPAGRVSPSDLEERAWPNSNHRHAPLTLSNQVGKSSMVRRERNFRLQQGGILL